MVDDPAEGEPPRDSGWQSPSGQEGAGPGGPPQPGQPQYGQPQYGEPGYQSPQYGQPQYPQPQQGQPGYQPPQYGQPQYGQPQYGQPQYGQPQYGQPQQNQPPPPGFPGYAPPPGYAQAPPVPTWGPAFADKPGIIPLRPLATGEILDGVFAAIRQNPKALLGLSFLVVLVGQIIDLALKLGLHDGGDGARALAAIGGYVVQSLAATVATGVAIVVISEAVLGTRISAGDVLNRLHGRIWRLVGLSLLVGLLTLVSFIAIVIPGIYVMVLLSFSTSIFVLERTTVGEALRRSSQLVRGNWWRTFGIGLLGYLVGGIISGLISIPFTIAAASSAGFFSNSTEDVSTSGQLLLSLGGLIGGTISTPIIAGTLALIYIDRRIRREGLDLVLAQTARERQGRS
jgi:hypothetical protein